MSSCWCRLTGVCLKIFIQMSGLDEEIFGWMCFQALWGWIHTFFYTLLHSCLTFIGRLYINYTCTTWLTNWLHSKFGWGWMDTSAMHLIACNVTNSWFCAPWPLHNMFTCIINCAFVVFAMIRQHVQLMNLNK